VKLTKEQHKIINSTGNIKINAIAGSGKTTTIIEYALNQPKHSKILYLAFNKSVKTEAIRKFKEKGLTNVVVETAHSLAYKNTVFKHRYKVRHSGYKTYEIAQLLEIQGNGEKHTEYIVANHINKFVTYFCNSDKLKIQDLNYTDLITDKKAKAFVTIYKDYIISKTRIFLSKMDKGEIEITHDFYLKKFQVSNPTLNFDFILFDEGQDASPAILDIFLKQKATKVIVGDTHQQIYGWRHAINSLEKTNFNIHHLSTSFRFSQEIANLSMEVLKWKKQVTNYDPISITGKGCSTEIKTKAIIARTNLGLLLKAIEYVTEKKKIKHIYFEGNINSYTYADDGASLYDILNLYTGKVHLIKDKLIKEMNNLDELSEYTKNTEDVQLGLMIEIVKEYGNDIPEIIKKIKEKHDEKEKAEMIFSTVHRAKGMEYDSVQIVNDYISEEKIRKLKNDAKNSSLDIAKINEEINLLYVAITRTKNSLFIPESLVSDQFPKSPQIHILRVEKKTEELEKSVNEKINSQINGDNEKAYSVEKIRESHYGAYRPWSSELDEELTLMFHEGINVRDLSKHFERTKGAIRSRIKKLELKEL
jgi:superfamily I DNA/RNA helicase